jgi:hypothetical protein
MRDFYDRHDSALTVGAVAVLAAVVTWFAVSSINTAGRVDEKARVAAEQNRRTLCATGHVLTAAPVRQRAGEPAERFARRLVAQHDLLRLLHGIDCRAVLARFHARRGDDKAKRGGVVVGGGSQPSGQPPPSGPGPGAEPQPNVHLPGTPLTPPVDICLPALCN